MSLSRIFDIAGAGMSAESVRLNTVASNLANADSVSSSAASAYRAKYPVFQAVNAGANDPSGASVKVVGVTQSDAAPASRYDPGNPLADSQGYVYSSNVNVIEEMTDMISASRSYQNNVEVLNTSRDMMLDTLKLGQS